MRFAAGPVRIAVLGAALLSPLPAPAQGTTDPQSIEYLRSEETRGALYRLGLYLDRELLQRPNPCPGEYQVVPVSYAILQPMAFRATSEFPVKGMWTFRYRFERCGDSEVFNALFLAKDSGPPEIQGLPPGTTRASPLLIRDTLMGVLTMALMKSGEGAKCKNAMVAGTTVTVPPHRASIDGAEPVDGVWEEEWTVRTCTTRVPVPVCFVPSRKGGTTWMVKPCPA